MLVSLLRLVAAGAVLTGIGCCGLMVCLLLCLHAYFIFNVRDEAVQTSVSLSVQLDGSGWGGLPVPST